ncbi:MAG: transcriptional regulator, TetR family [Polaromonas sp.]|nr:transcriptional regulator, TetR family [Polaromonas sp.]
MLTPGDPASTLLTSQSVTMSPPKLFCCPVQTAVTRHERRKEARPGELLKAALELFVEKGFAATRVEEVAARAGVSKGTLFLYFPSKEELFKAVVRENITTHFKEVNAEFDAFEGTTLDMIGFCMNSWWDRVGASRASGITKLMMSEANNFPEIAAFYQQEVSLPGQQLIRRVLQRGIDSGEFRSLDMDYAVYSIVAPMVFLILSRHSLGICVSNPDALDPKKYIASQLSIILYGLRPLPGDAVRPAIEADR